MATRLHVHPAYFRRLRHYRDKIIRDGRPQVARRFVHATEEQILQLLRNPARGHSARFESTDLADILRIGVPGFTIFAIFYRWGGQTLSLMTIEHTAQDLPSRLAGLLTKA